MALIGSLNVLLQASTEGLTKGLAKAKTKVSDFVKGWVPSWQTVALAAGAAAIAAGAAFVSLAQQASENAGRLDDLAQNIGTTVDHLHSLEYAAHMSGVSAGDLEGIFSKLNVLLAEAALNGGPTAKALEAIGLNASELTKLDITDAFKRISTGLAKVDHEGQRASLAMDIFGKAGTKAIQFVTRGASGIEELEQRAKRLGIVMSQADADKLNAAQDAIDELGFISQAAGAKLAADLAPALITLIQLFTEGENTGADMQATMNALADITVVATAAVVGIGDASWDSFTMARHALYKFVEFGGKGLLSVVEAANMVSKALGKGNLVDPGTIDNLRLFLEESSAETARVAAEANRSNAGVDFWNKYSNATNTFTESLKKNRDALAAQRDEMSKGEREAEKWIEQLQEQLQTVGMTTDEAKLWKLQQQEINSVLTDQAKALLDEIKAKEESIQAEKDLAKAREEAHQKFADQMNKMFEDLEEKEKAEAAARKAAADGVRDSVKTDKDRMNEEIARLTQMFLAGDINDDTFNKAIKKAQGDKGPQDVRFAGLAEKGSAEARASIMRNQAMNPQNKVAENTAKLVKQGEQMVNGIMKVAEGVGNFVGAKW